MKLKIALLCVVSAVILTITGCSQDEAESTKNDIPNFSITVTIANEKTVEFTDEVAEEIGPVEMIAAVKDKDELLESATYTGINLYDLLDYVGVESFSVISIESTSGGIVELDPTRIDESGTGFAWEKDGESLTEEQGLVKLVNNERGPKHWLDNVTAIVIIK